ncbi:MAG: hypothetical protein GY838_10030 [bacterium]|nr:hypothetical protein [bacterium]
MSLPHSLPAARLAILLIILLAAPLAWADDTAAPDSARIATTTVDSDTTAPPQPPRIRLGRYIHRHDGIRGSVRPRRG